MSTTPRMRRTSVTVCTLVLLLFIAMGIAPASSKASTANSDVGCQPGLEGGSKPILGADTAKLCPPHPASHSHAPLDSSAGSTTPAPGSKNAIAPIAFDSHGITHSGVSARGSKNYDGTRTDVAPQATTLTSAASAGGVFNACGPSSNLSWTTTSTSFQVIRSCTLTLPEDGVVYLNASTSVGLSSDMMPFEARFSLNIDSATSGNAGTDRWVNIYTDSGDGTDKSAAVTMLASLSAGTHTFYFLGSRYSGSGTVQLYDPVLSVVYFPASAAEIKTCGVVGNFTWTMAQATFQQIRTCSLDLPAPGFVYISGTASVGLSSDVTAYEGRFRVGVDAVDGIDSSDRRVNIYTDSGDGTDETLATSLLTSVGAGAHTFYFSGARSAGAGSVLVYDPTLSVIYFPSPSVTVAHVALPARTRGQI